MVTDVSAVGSRVRVERRGSFGVVPSETATALAMVLTELLQNAVEHGYDPGEQADPDARGEIVLTARRLVGRLHVSVDDDGRGLPEDFDLDASSSLGLSIVRTLVESELGGQLTLGARPGGPGTRAEIDVPVE